MPITGGQIKAARTLLGLTAKELATEIGLAQSTVSAVETGRHKSGPALDRLETALRAAGVEFTNGGQPGVRMCAEGSK